MGKQVEQLDQVTIRFAGDSGDGMQLTGGQFTSETALLGNDLSTFPDFPAEIRAPAGSLPGVSGFQLHFADHDILTPGDRPDVLVAMNPAALKTNLGDLPKGGTLIVDTDAFTERNLKKAGYETNPIEDGSLADYQAHAVQYEVKPAQLPPGLYRQITGNMALSWGLLAASRLSQLPLFLGAYPITPASSILEELAKHKAFGVRTFQAEDEIAAAGAALGAAFGGSLGVTTSAGPGVVLKSETVGLAIALELPLVIVDVQRAGPSTGMPTKPEQGDLLMVLFGRNSESPVPVIAPSSPGDCFGAAIEAARIALKYRTPVYLLSDAYLANGAEPWLIPDVGAIPRIAVDFAEPSDGEFLPYARDPETLARPWAIPGTPGLEHRIGGLEKANETGNVSYDPENHDLMTRLRAQKVAAIVQDIPPLDVDHQEGADVLVLSWGGTYGPVAAGVRRVRRSGGRVSHAHLRYLNPFPRNLGDVLRSYDRVLIPEMNLGQLLRLVRSEFLVDAVGYNRVSGKHFRASEVEEAIQTLL